MLAVRKDAERNGTFESSEKRLKSSFWKISNKKCPNLTKPYNHPMTNNIRSEAKSL